MIKSKRKDAISDIAQSYVVKKKLNPNEPLPVDEVVKVLKKNLADFFCIKL